MYGKSYVLHNVHAYAKSMCVKGRRKHEAKMSRRKESEERGEARLSPRRERERERRASESTEARLARQRVLNSLTCCTVFRPAGAAKDVR